MVSQVCHCDANGANCGRMGLERRVEDPEPAGQIRFDRQLLLQLGFELQLLGVVALLAFADRNEGPEGTPLVPVDPVHGLLAAFELEDRGEELASEARFLEPLGNCVNPGYLVLQVRVTDDDPRVAERVLAALELRAGLCGYPIEELLQVVLGAHEVARRERLENDPSRAGRTQSELRVERDGSGAQGEQPLARRTGELPRLEAPRGGQSTGRPISRAISARAARRFSSGGCVRKSPLNEPFTLAGMMKNAFMLSTSRRSRCGIRNISLEIFCSALIRFSGAPVMRAEPRSAANSR